MTRPGRGAVEVALAQGDAADAAAAADYVRLLVAVVVVGGEARTGIEPEEDGGGVALVVDGQRLHAHAGKRERLPGAFVAADGTAVLRCSADGVEDAAAKLGRRRHRLDRLGDDRVEHLQLLSGQVAHLSTSAQPARAVPPFRRRSYDAIPILRARAVRPVREE